MNQTPEAFDDDPMGRAPEFGDDDLDAPPAAEAADEIHRAAIALMGGRSVLALAARDNPAQLVRLLAGAGRPAAGPALKAPPPERPLTWFEEEALKPPLTVDEWKEMARQYRISIGEIGPDDPLEGPDPAPDVEIVRPAKRGPAW